MSTQARIWTLQGIALLGMIVSVYLYLASASESFYCPIGDCSTVNQSEYAKVFGVPVSLLGFAYYILLFAAAMLSERPWMARVTHLLLLGGLLFSLYLTYLELFVIHAICFWCVLSFLLVILGNLAFLFKPSGGRGVPA